MNTVPRLFFATLSALAIGIFVYGCKFSDKLSDGQILMLWSLIPASLMLSTAICYTKEHADKVIAIMVMFAGIFFALLSFGMYKQSGEVAYGMFAWLGIMLCGTSIAVMMFYIIPRTCFSRS